MRKINVFWWNGLKKEQVGTLAEAPRTPIMFEWNKNFLLSNIELSPIRFKKVPDLIECPSEPFNGLPGLFADCVPDGWGKLLLKIGLTRQGITSTDISPLDAMAYIGENGMGALSFEPALKNPSDWAEGKISLSDLERGIKPIIDGTPSAVIEAFLENGASPNGIRPKIILKEKNGVFYSASSSKEADEWIIKFKADSDPKGIGKLEYIYSKLARASGLEIPETKLFASKGNHYFGVKRFDRTAKGRLHVHTLSGMLHVAPGNFTVGYEHFAKATQYLTQDIREVEKVFRLATFNVFAINHDDHSKNVAFIMDEQGKWKVAPAYDLTFYKSTYQEHKMPILGNGNPQEKDLNAFGISLGISKQKTAAIIEQVKDSLSKFKKLSNEIELSKSLQKIVLDALDDKRSKKRGLEIG